MRIINNLRRHIGQIALLVLAAAIAQLALRVDPDVALAMAISAALIVVITLPDGDRS